MPEAGQGTVAAFKVSGTDIVKDQGTVGEVTFGESVFDGLLPLEQPVQSAVEEGFVKGVVEAEQGSQRGGGGFLSQTARGGEFGGRLEDASDDHGDDEVALGAMGTGEDTLEAKAAKRAQHRRDMAVGE